MQATSTARPFTTKKEFYAQFKKKSIAQELWLRFLKNKTAVIGLVNMVLVKGSRESALSNPTGISYAIPVRHLQALLQAR